MCTHGSTPKYAGGGSRGTCIRTHEIGGGVEKGASGV